MHRFMKWAVALFFLVVTGVLAQDPGVPEGATVKLLLLRQKSVQKELEVGADVAQKVQAFTTAQADAAMKALDLGDAARKEAFGKLAKMNEKFLTDTLSAKQNKRLDQIAMQFAALTHLLEPEMTKELKLSDAQVGKLKELQVDARKELVEVFKSKEATGKNEKFAKLRDETRTKILAVLNDDQKAKVREIAGPPFTGEIVFEEYTPSKDK
jgi:hypothetical protein